MIFGSADLGWETRRDEGYIQVHWHLAMWTSNPVKLAEKLKANFASPKSTNAQLMFVKQSISASWPT